MIPDIVRCHESERGHHSGPDINEEMSGVSSGIPLVHKLFSVVLYQNMSWCHAHDVSIS